MIFKIQRGGGGTSGRPIQVLTAEDMTALITTEYNPDNVGKLYQYRGEDGEYKTNELYQLVVADDIPTLSRKYTPSFQVKSVTPLLTPQTITPSAGYDGISSVLVLGFTGLPQLNAPSIALKIGDANTLQITDGANGNFTTGFRVYADDELLDEIEPSGSPTEVDMTDYPDAAGKDLTVTAVGGSLFTASDPSNVIVWVNRLAPPVISFSDGIFSWAAVTGADIYYVYATGEYPELIGTVSTTSFDVGTHEFSSAAVYPIYVKAHDTSGTLSDSLASNAIDYYVYELTSVTVDHGLDGQEGRYIGIGQSMTVTIYPDPGYSLPDSVTVTGALHTYDSETGVITIYDATSDFSVYAECIVPPLTAPRVTLAGSKLRIYDDDGRAESYSIYSGDELLTVVPKAEV